MYQLLMFGTGNSSVLVENVLNDQCQILAYVDNDEKRWGQIRRGVPIVGPDQIGSFDYDFIIIGSQFNTEIYQQLINRGISKHKIFQYYFYMDNYYNNYEDKINRFLNFDGKVEVLATGISYAAAGFREDVCKKEAFNFSCGSQDLFYDYRTVKYLLEEYPLKTKNISNAIIGLCYYSFQYDLSLSILKNKIAFYYPVLKNSHHYKDIELLNEQYQKNRKKADKLISREKCKFHQISRNSLLHEELQKRWEIGKSRAEWDGNKHYPKTVEENTQILKDYLNLLQEHSIKATLVVYPVTRYYAKYFPKAIEEEFHSIIHKLQSEYEFTFVDAFQSPKFDDGDFFDVSHLNWRGAEKFTRLLNRYI